VPKNAAILYEETQEMNKVLATSALEARREELKKRERPPPPPVAITVEELRKGTMIDVPKETRDILYQGQ
jgi:hypothetical protein